MNKSKLRKYDKEIVKRYLKGESSRNIARSLSTSDSAVSYRLMVNNIAKRSISQATHGRPKSKVQKEKLSDTRRRLGLARGKRNPNWKGGVQDNWSQLKNSFGYKKWRNDVFKRDCFECQICGYEKGGILEPHHIFERKNYPELTLIVENGITVCKYCHWKLHSKWASYKMGELLENPTVKSGAISSRAILDRWKVQRLCTQLEREDIVWSI